MSLGRIRSVLDFLLRLTFFASAPFLLVFVAAIFPVTGAMVQVGIALAAFFAGEALRRLVTRSKLARSALSPQLQFEAYYRAHPPRPFLYYVFYPLLFPYWTVVRDARSEFLLFKGYTVASFLLLVASLVVQFLRSFPPELTLRDFAPIAAGTFLVELFVVLMFLMPIVTSVVHFHTRTRRSGSPRSSSWHWSPSRWPSAARAPPRPVVSFATRIRVTLRTAAKPAAAQQAEERALRAAWKVLPKEKGDVESDGKIEGDVLDARTTPSVRSTRTTRPTRSISGTRGAERRPSWSFTSRRARGTLPSFSACTAPARSCGTRSISRGTHSPRCGRRRSSRRSSTLRP